MQALSKIMLFSLHTLKGKNYAKIVITKKNGRINHSGWLYFLQSKVTPNDIYEIIAQFSLFSFGILAQFLAPKLGK